MGYTEALLREMATVGKLQVVAFHETAKKKSSHTPKATCNVTYLSRSELTQDRTRELARSKHMIGVFASGWNHAPTRALLREFRRQKKPAIIGMDNRWRGTLRQRLACLTSPGYLKRLCDGLFVPGPEQYEYGRRLGFTPKQIETGFYSADCDHFSIGASAQPKDHSARRRVLFVGRLSPEKGILEFARAFSRITAETGAQWELQIAGTGPLAESLRALPHVSLTGFCEPKSLGALLRDASAFVLPSLSEPWGVALHEAACAAKPILCSVHVGAARSFAINDYNAILFDPLDEHSTSHAVRSLIQLSDSQREAMGQASKRLASGLHPESTAARLLSLLARVAH